MAQLRLQPARRTLDGMSRPGFLVAAGVALAILAGGVTLPSGAAAHRGSKSPDVVYFRSVLCFAPSYNPTIPDLGPLSPWSCSAASRLNEGNLGVNPDANSAALADRLTQARQRLRLARRLALPADEVE